ncbi:AraC family transcriptional regulator [Legionella sp. km772]|uniref:AraC family transcriptional regulator n=1 Tax=Legionella sp. km772 TaxID=2498111 RepID=UPI0013158A21|nr:AraC family transcriptional regulator [Legionella sp. km772]
MISTTLPFFNTMELRSYQIDSLQHSHDYAQLVLPVKGVLDLEIGPHSGMVNQDTAAFIAAGEKHCFSGSNNNLFVVLDINTPVEHLFKSPFCSLSASDRKLISFTQTYLSHSLVDHVTQNIISRLLLKTLAQTNASPIDTPVLKAKNWLDTHFTQPININHLAKQCYLSASQLQRRFKKVMGCTLADYWRNKKMEHAEYLLATSTLSIEHIAFSLGYEHLSTFTRFFTQQYGEPPSKWRLNLNNASK